MLDLSLKNYMIINNKYRVGIKLCFLDPQSGESFNGLVVDVAEKIIVDWETGLTSEYDTSWLDKFTTIIQ
jgi:hypothetical protein